MEVSQRVQDRYCIVVQERHTDKMTPKDPSH